MVRDGLEEEEWADARAVLAQAVRNGLTILRHGGTAIDAVEAAVVVMEESPHFNAGHGAALNADGRHELDASIMDGATTRAGAVTLVRRTRNPIKAARAVMDRGDMVLIGGEAADDYAAAAGLEMVDPAWFTTPRRVKALAAMKEHANRGTIQRASESEKHGTVGAVALDQAGHLAAATSTGGYNDKPAGRIGDSPIIGAGTYARDGVCAVSGTGQGEFFIRHAVAHEVASRVAYLGESVATAAARVVHQDLAPYGIGAGLVVVGADGSVTTPYNTPGMYRGWSEPDGSIRIATHDEIHAFPVTG